MEAAERSSKSSRANDQQKLYMGGHLHVCTHVHDRAHVHTHTHQNLWSVVLHGFHNDPISKHVEGFTIQYIIDSYMPTG
jgi:hypothetical protein